MRALRRSVSRTLTVVEQPEHTPAPLWLSTKTCKKSFMENLHVIRSREI